MLSELWKRTGQGRIQGRCFCRIPLLYIKRNAGFISLWIWAVLYFKPGMENFEMALKQKICEEYEQIFSSCDIILTPTAPTVAYGLNENISDPAKMYQADICTVGVNLAALPAISTTCGYDANGMPIGMSVIGKKWDEGTIIQAADAFEKNFTRVPARM